ncbi:MAG: SipW-dependent-type signal peptide-containing protein [Clostridiales bacterium]|nr:SipW-dependent-type signal peptide-containing protein [Clostridiales bacterium]
MSKQNSAKRTLIYSIFSLLICVSMLAGTTFAWFNDSVSTGLNTIVAGNLDIQLEYKTGVDAEGEPIWEPVDPNTSLFKPAEGENATLWEPGHTEYVQLRIRNAGTLALKYKLTANIYANASGGSEKSYTSVEKNASGTNAKFKVSQYLVFNKIEGAADVHTREELWISDRDIEKNAMGATGLSAVNGTDIKLDNSHKTDVFTLAVYMPTWVDNAANQLTSARDSEGAPTIYISLSLFATQVSEESDGFGTDYDKDALYGFEMSSANTAASLRSALTNKSIKLITVTEDISQMTPFTDSIGKSRNYTIDVSDSHVAFSPSRTFGFMLRYLNNTVTLKGNNGSYTATDNVVWLSSNEGTVNIEGGNFLVNEGGSAVIYAEKGTVNISGGYFELLGAENPTFLLNCKDDQAAAGNAKIVVTGGTFVNFDPSDNQADGQGTNYVAEGYKVVSQEKDGKTLYTVIPEE